MSVATGHAGLSAPRRKTRPAAQTTRQPWVRRTSSLALALLAVVVNTAAYGLVNVMHRGAFMDQLVAWSACGMLVVLAIVFLLMGRHAMHRSFSHIEQQLKALTREQRIAPVTGPIPDDLENVTSALKQYVDHVVSKMDHLRLQKKELSIQMRAADAERKHTEAIIFSISDAVLVIDPFGSLLLANTAAESWFNFSLAESKLRPIEKVIDDNSLVALIRDVRDLGQVQRRRQVEYSALRNGRTHVFNITLSSIVDDKGETSGIVAVFHDVTREREVSQIKTDFVSSVSHELRTPLSSIKAYIEMLLDGEAQDDKVRNEFYHIIELETERLQRLVSNVLDISRIESGVIDGQLEPHSINHIVHDVARVMEPQAKEKNITLSVEAQESLLPVAVNKDLLHQAIMNLVSNAVKYTDVGGHVTVSTQLDVDSGRLVLSVKDDGIGIPAEDLPRVFEKFYRTKHGTAFAKGTGLGLNLVKHIVETVHHGDISVTSERGAGTTVVVRLPARSTTILE